MRMMLMGVAAAALAASGAYAQPGNGNGNGKGNGGGPAAAAKQHGNGDARGGPGGGKGNGNAGKHVRERGNGGGKAMAQAGPSRGNGNGNGNGNAPSFDRSNGNGNGKNKGPDLIRAADRNGNPGKARNGRDDYDIFSYSRRDYEARNFGLIDGCPPGLAKKQNGCNPPGLLKRGNYDYDRSGWWGLPGLSDGRYRYYDNNLVRLSPTGSILGYYPLLGGALSAGNVWPSWFDYEPVPSYYESYYGLGSRGSYRYADNALYRVDPETAAITSIAALLTGDTIQVGQPMPSGYGVYNVPYGYRDRYYDRPDAMYRYSDGYVYEIDPATMLVSSAIELLI